MTILSRREFLLAVAIGITAYFLPGRQARAADKAALLVAPHGKLGTDLKELRGMRVCAGSKANAPESGYPELLRQRGASIISLPMSERIVALETGVCGALLFVSAEKSNKELEEELKIFFPPLAYYEFTAFPTN